MWEVPVISKDFCEVDDEDEGDCCCSVRLVLSYFCRFLLSPCWPNLDSFSNLCLASYAYLLSILGIINLSSPESGVNVKIFFVTCCRYAREFPETYLSHNIGPVPGYGVSPASFTLNNAEIHPTFSRV